MATIKTKGTGQAMMVLDSSTKKPIDIPLFAQEAIMTPIVNLKTWINKRMRTGGTGKMVPGGTIKYYAYPKQTEGRDVEITYDDTTGKINGGMFGAESNGMIGGINSTYGTNLVYDELTLQPAKFLKHIFSNFDAKTEGLANLVGMKLKDFTADIAETALVSLKAVYVLAMGTLGKWASDEGFILPTTALGKRIKAKDYTVDEAGGLAAIDDITSQLEYRDKIGLKDGVEKDYPLARGLNSSLSTIIEISSGVNKAIQIAVKDSKNGFIPGVGINKDLGVVNYIAYNGKTVKVEVVNDMPNKGGKTFNWNIIEVGKYGAMALPNKWNANSIVRPHYEGLSKDFKVLEATGLLKSLKFLQPELMFSSFGA